MRAVWFPLCWLLVGCSGGGRDADEDGFSAQVDCDDDDAKINPQAAEICDGIDNDCDGAVDEADRDLDASTAEGLFYVDADGDGFGDPATEVLLCEGDDDLILQGGDCDDMDANRHPGLIDICDGIDNDCDDSTSGAGVWFIGDDGSTRDHTAFLNQQSTGSSEIELYVLTVTEPGTLNVCEGEWVMQIDVQADLDIVAPAGPSVTALDGQGVHRGIVVEDEVDLTVSNLTLRNFFDEGKYYEEGFGGALWCQGPATVTADNLVLSGNQATFGGSVAAMEGCSLNISNSTFDGSTGVYGGHLAVYEADATVSDSRFEGGEGIGGAIAINVNSFELRAPFEPSIVSCTNCEVVDNSSTHAGGIFVGGNGRLVMNGGRIDGNEALFGAGMYVSSFFNFGSGRNPAVAELTDVAFANQILTPLNDAGDLGFGLSVLVGTDPNKTKIPLEFDFEGTTQTIECDDRVGCR
ncbi:MAG: putative metal-binding motif-containing protein [Myxococcales bacterium]|nr:putative metal-binding motif-containing protein [Myxococcales bacterium]